MIEGYTTIAEASVICSVPIGTIRCWVASGKLVSLPGEASRCGKPTRYVETVAVIRLSEISHGLRGKTKVKPLEDRGVFTTGQVAKICQVAPRTVSKWFDSGKLNGYRLPGADDRRIPRDELIRFLKMYKFPLGALADDLPKYTVLMVALDGVTAESIASSFAGERSYAFTRVGSVFEAGVRIGGPTLSLLLIDVAIGRENMYDIALSTRKKCAATQTIAFGGEDENDIRPYLDNGFDLVFFNPINPLWVIDGIRLLVKTNSDRRVSHV